MKFLRDKGYKLTPSWEWVPPAGTTQPELTEQDAILFLIEEYDFGGVYYEEEE